MDEFSAITGVDADTAAMYMEMSGYDLDTAIQLFFSMSDGGGGGGGEEGSGSGSGSSGWSYDWINLLFSSADNATIPHAWLHQGLQTSAPAATATATASQGQGQGQGQSAAAAADWAELSILQHKNGPCGVLAAYQGYLLTHLLKSNILSPTYVPTPHDCCHAISNLLQTVSFGSAGGSSIKICSWKDAVNGVGQTVNIEEWSMEVMQAVVQQFLAPGGVLLLLYSVLHTFGVDILRQQHSQLLPLVYGSNSLCSSALMNILLSGEAREALGAYDDFGTAIQWNKPAAAVGLLSGTEIELKMKIHDGFKFPTHEVYVLHGRDHFTTLLVLPSLPLPHPPNDASPWAIAMPPPLPYTEENSTSSAANSVTFSGVHFNGLPPAGPAVTQVTVTAPEGVCRLTAPTAALGIGKEYKPVVNTVDCIVQASSDDKSMHPKEWKRWRYEVALAIDDPDNQSEERPKDLPPLPTFDCKAEPVDPTIGWRCRLCFETRFSTMCFGQNDPGTNNCQHCSRSRDTVGWTMWMPYDQLPSTWKAYVDRQYGPMFTTVLRTKWPNCNVQYSEGTDYPVV